MLDILEHGVTLTATTTLVLVVAIPLSPAAVGLVVPLHHTVTQMTKLDCGVQQCNQLVNANIIIIVIIYRAMQAAVIHAACNNYVL